MLHYCKVEAPCALVEASHSSVVDIHQESASDRLSTAVYEGSCSSVHSRADPAGYSRSCVGTGGEAVREECDLGQSWF